MKVATAPQSDLWASSLIAPPSLSAPPIANIVPLTARDGGQHGDFVSGADGPLHFRVLAVNGEGEGVSHGGEVRVPVGEERPDLGQGSGSLHRELDPARSGPEIGRAVQQECR